MDIILDIKGIDKRFGAVHALKNIDLHVIRGETLALVGENGAGKSTLVKILTGAYRKDTGNIFINGKEAIINNTADVREYGIGQVYQHVEVAPELTVAENIFLGEKRFGKKGFVNWDDLFSSADALLKKYKIDVSPSVKVKTLSVAYRQLISVVKVLQRNPDIVIFDEPTAVLSDNEVESLFEIIHQLKESKITIIYISHRLDEVFKLADRIAVMRDGEMVTVLKNENLTKDDLIVHMLGRKVVVASSNLKAAISDETVLEVKNVTTDKLHDVSFSLKKGEILGMAGLVGSGRTELARAIYGLDGILSGEVLFHGKLIKKPSPKEALRNGVFLAPEDRRGHALVLGRSIRENISLSSLDKISKHGVNNDAKDYELAEGLKESLNIKALSVDTPVGDLSGGNQQKVVVGKAMAINPNIIIFDEPTQGIDVGAKSEIYDILDNMQQNGLSVIFISSEMEELQRICNRIIVMRNGKIAGEIREKLENTESILQLMYRGEEK